MSKPRVGWNIIIFRYCKKNFGSCEDCYLTYGNFESFASFIKINDFKFASRHTAERKLREFAEAGFLKRQKVGNQVYFFLSNEACLRYKKWEALISTATNARV